jgi:hypothetical protein
MMILGPNCWTSISSAQAFLQLPLDQAPVRWLVFDPSKGAGN